MKKLIFPILSLLFFAYACDGGDYLIDGGLSNPNTGTTTLEFFKSHDQLDTLAIIIERAGMEDVVNGNVTMFAPNNLSIKNYVDKVLAEMRESDPLAEFTVNDIPVDTLTKYLGSYIFEGRITRENMPKDQGSIYTAINGEERRISLEAIGLYGNELENYPEFVFLTYKVGTDWDEWDATVNDSNEKDDKFVVRTSNIMSNNGVIHVLQGGHTLFNYERD
ncbi:fasciclin domain-containing protein [Aestuariibaculum suncheonense]|uniref:Fasciclin domain-containing protein n=1 Tax=Aestuariibaculum suncheonense TaxID=1028745 RepID=A0A8J6QBD3_9FLAO|nr:fasciclin domain-containing protein [Aestuariibaculum suncheonense]MBD0836936.1 fasciclin domain-containing protein [Aestuariibaculum suncheonense]